MKTKNLKQSVRFKAKPSDVYEALMDSKKHARFSGSPAKVSRKVGGKFSFFENYIYGDNVELVENKKMFRTGAHKAGRKGISQKLHSV